MGCTTSLVGITTDCKETNVGGIKTTVYIANKEDVTIELETQKDAIKSITMKSDTYFTPFSFRKQSANLVSNWTIDDVAGVKYCTSDLSLKFARQDSKKRMEMQALMLGEFVVLVKDQNDTYWFLGYDNPVTATQGGADTGTASSDANGYSITLQDISKAFPYQYNGTDDDIKAMLKPISGGVGA